MSLRRRLAVVLVLGLSALVIAFAAIGHLLASTNASRESAAETNADAGAQALVEAAAAFPEGADAASRRKLQDTAEAAVRPVAGGNGGYCSRDGALLTNPGRMGRPDGKGHGLGPEQRDRVAALCMLARSGEPVHGRVETPRGVDLLTVIGVGAHSAAWFTVRARARDGAETPAWPWEVGLLAAAAVALAAFTVDAMIALRRGADELQGALVRLQDDLRAPVPRPRARELGEIAAGLSAMAVHLADARDRERALESTLARAQRLSALGRVVAGVAHEVRNPLAGMKLRLDLLVRTGSLDSATREDITVCLGEIARLNRVVESLLMVSRAKTLAERRIDLAELADARIERIAPIAQKSGVRLSREGEGAASFDHDALAGAVDNLLRNAVEASPPGSEVRVRVGAGVIDVEDAGPGVPEARRAELFEPFFTTKPEGTGLGLWISRLLLEAKGATLRYDRVGDRTRMRIAFARPASESAPASATIPPTLP